jgi:hypothetical protein
MRVLKDKIMSKSEKSVGVSFRIPYTEHALLSKDAEARNVALSDVLRERLKASQREIEMDDALRQLEQRMLRKVFILTCAINGLDSEQAKVANERYKGLMRSGDA